ncbi:MAG: hypothetical protein AAB897_00865 [Patescibacteria group bacterium]
MDLQNVQIVLLVAGVALLIASVAVFLLRRAHADVQGSLQESPVVREAVSLGPGDRVTYPHRKRTGNGKATILSIKDRRGEPWARMFNGSSFLSRPLRELQRA